MTYDQLKIMHEELKKRLKCTAQKNLGAVSLYADNLLDRIYQMEVMIMIKNTQTMEREQKEFEKELGI